MVMVHLIPILILNPFVTLDGPAHLYNAVLIDQLIKGDSSHIAEVFVFNSFPEPNWIGHAIMVLFLQVFSSLVAEKLLQLFIVIATAWGFRLLVKAMDPGRTPWIAWFVFPLLYNFTFLLGFYNFSVGIALLLVGIAWWLTNTDHALSVRQWILVGLWAGLLYFSHLVVFLIGMGLAGLIILFRKQDFSWEFRIKNAVVLVVCCFPWIALTLAYLLKSGSTGFRGDVVHLSSKKLFEDLFQARMLIAYEPQQELVLTRLYSQFLLLMFSLGVIKRSISPVFIVFLLNAAVAIAMYFLMPDSMAGGGILSVRLLLWLIISVVLLLVASRLPEAYARPGAWISAALSCLLMYMHAPDQFYLSRDARRFIATANQIPHKAFVLPLNYSGNWLHSNFPAYVGAINGSLVWDNYEANEGVFPLHWQKGMNPELHLGNHVSSSRPCVSIASSESLTGIALSHVLVWKRNGIPEDSCSLDVQRQLIEGFDQIQGDDPSVFRLRAGSSVR